MSDMEMAALRVLRAAAELYNDAEILRDAIEGDERDQFSADYIEGERRMVLDASSGLQEAISELLLTFEIEVK